MYFVDEGFLLLARSGRTPHMLPLHRSRDDPKVRAAQRELRELVRVLAPPRAWAVPLRAANTVASVLRRDVDVA